MFGHHPWFLYDENEDPSTLEGKSSFGGETIGDSYFSMALEPRSVALELFKEFGVTAAFCGHFHQNLVSETSFGMKHIITGSLSVVLNTTGITAPTEPQTRGIRVVEVGESAAQLSHEFISLP